MPVAVVGAGGVSRAIVAGLTDAGAKVTIYNRTVERAEKLAADKPGLRWVRSAILNASRRREERRFRRRGDDRCRGRDTDGRGARRRRDRARDPPRSAQLLQSRAHVVVR